MRRNRAISLGTTVLIILLLTTVGLALSSLAVSHLTLQARYASSENARRLADSVLALAIDKLRTDATYGVGHPAGTGLTVHLAGLDNDAVGLLTFDQAQAAGWKMPWSTNNLNNPASPGWAGQAVDRDMAYLLAVGRCGGVERTVKVWLHVPAFPAALSSNGPVRGENGLVVAGLRAVPSPGATPDLIPSHLVCNAGGSESVFLGPHSTIKGDVRSAGHVVIDPTGPVSVEGAIREGSTPQALPEVNLASYDPVAKGLGHETLREDTVASKLTVENAMRREGDLTVSGGLHLAPHSLLYVEGDLTVRGGVTGEGVLVCTGKVTVEGTTSLSSGSGVALLAGGDVALSGAGPEGSYFQGLVYTKGGFSADQVTVCGPLMASGQAPSVFREARMLLPPGVPEEWTVGGSGGTYSDNTRYAVFKVGGIWKKEPLGEGDSWSTALVYEKRPDGKFTQWTFAPGSGTPGDEVMSRRKARDALRDMLGDTGFTEFDGVVDQLMAQGDGTPPPPPPARLGRPAVLSVKPSQFLRLEERLRVALWLES